MHKQNSRKKDEIVFSTTISMTIQTRLYEEDSLNCHMCGLAHGEIDWTTGRKARLHIEYATGGTNEDKGQLSGLQASCSICLEGRRAMKTERPTASSLLSKLQEADSQEQFEVLNRLRSKFTA